MELHSETKISWGRLVLFSNRKEYFQYSTYARTKADACW